MLDSFETLGLPRKLALAEEQIRAAYLDSSKLATPETQAALNAAMQQLLAPDKRLKHLMDLAAPEEAKQWRAVNLSDDLLSEFTRLGACKNHAEALLARHAAAQSALARALLAPQLMSAMELAEECAMGLAQKIDASVAELPSLDESLEWSQIAVRQAHLAYLMKWQAQARELILRLHEAQAY